MTFEEEALASLGLREAAGPPIDGPPELPSYPKRFLRGLTAAEVQTRRRDRLTAREAALAATISKIVHGWQTAFLAACRTRHLLEADRLREVGPYKKPLPPPNKLPPPPDVPAGYVDAANAAYDPQPIEDALIEAYEVELLLGQNTAADDAALDLGFDLKWDVVPEKAIAGYRKYAADFADSVVGDDRDLLMETIENAMKAGTSPGALANDLETFFSEGIHRVARDGTPFVNGVKDWSDLVARTELARAYNGGARDLYESAGYTKWMWVAAHDERECEYCEEADGRVMDIGEIFEGVDVEQPPAHPNCVPAGTLVASDAEGATVRAYKGNVVTIVLEAGQKLTATPNHPIATRAGWVAIGDLREGDDVLCGTRIERKPSSVDPYDDQMEPAIEDVAKSFTVIFPAMPSAAEDFHGDGAGSEVHIVRSDRKLLGDRTATCAQHGRELALDDALISARRLDAKSASREFFRRRFRASSCLVSSGGEAPVLLRRTARDVELVGLANPSNRHALLEQNAVNPGSADPERLCERLLAFASEITTSKVRSVEVELFQGDVYSLSTVQGWHTANSIVTHNCLCVMLADPDAIAKTDKDMNDPEDESPPGEEEPDEDGGD